MQGILALGLITHVERQEKTKKLQHIGWSVLNILNKARNSQHCYQTPTTDMDLVVLLFCKGV